MAPAWKYILVTSGMLVLAACASRESPDVTVSEPPPTEPEVGTLPQGPWKAGNISQALAGKSFSYVMGASRGNVTYNSDFTFTYTEEGKGEGTGIWQPSDESLCEAYDPTKFLPRGSPSRCQPFSTIENTYAVGSKRLTPA